MKAQEELMTPGEVCTLLRISRQTLYEMRMAGRIKPAFQNGRVVRFRKTDLLPETPTLTQ